MNGFYNLFRYILVYKRVWGQSPKIFNITNITDNDRLHYNIVYDRLQGITMI